MPDHPTREDYKTLAAALDDEKAHAQASYQAWRDGPTLGDFISLCAELRVTWTIRAHPWGERMRYSAELQRIDDTVVISDVDVDTLIRRLVQTVQGMWA